MLSTLEEVSLHQLDLGSIKGLDTYCRALKIIYLQNNLISKMEGLRKLKDLEYLNLAVNNIKVIEGVAECECLGKLDLTLNFVDIEDLKVSMDNLQDNWNLHELYLLGNPCTNWEPWKDYVVARIDTLRRIDGDDITPAMRLAAKRNLKEMEEDLL